MSNYDPTDIQQQERSRERASTRDRAARETEESDFKWLMSNKRGRRIIWRQLDTAGVFRSSFNTNAMSMAFTEGNRNVGLKLVGLIHALCPELYPTMVKENSQNDSRSNADDE